MKRFIAVVFAMAAVAIFAETETHAQSYLGGYQFGAGLQGNCGSILGGVGNRFQREQPPYFAKFPPVYYGHIVKRPYGISPFAAPAGIAPVEMSYPAPTIPQPITKVNPYYKGATPVVDQKESESKTELRNKVTLNPFYRPGQLSAK